MLLSVEISACNNKPDDVEIQTGLEEDLEKKESETIKTPEGIAYQNIFFDYANEISEDSAKSTEFTTPEKLKIDITVVDQNGATGVQLVGAVEESNTIDYYMNAYVAGNELTFSGDIQSAFRQIGSEPATEIEVTESSIKLIPNQINADEPVDEVITITLTDGIVYKIHTVSELIADMDITANGEADKGVYTFAIDKFLIRVNTEGNIVYYRNVGCIGTDLMAENFMAQDTEDGRFYTYYVELKPEWRNANGGFSSGMYVVMDENYSEVNYITLNANEDKNHSHGEGYLDQHEFVMLGANHWIALSYTPMFVENLPGNGIDGGNTGYVYAGIIQEVENGQIIQEINTVDYEIFYQSALECNDFKNSTDQGTADDFKDYVHVNSVAIDPKDGNYIISMRHQYAVYKFNRETGELMWTLGGTQNEFSGLDDVIDEEGNLFIGQHYVKYVDSAVVGNDSTITVFDNHTSFEENLTRTLEIVLDEEAKTATATATVIQGSDLDAMTQKVHWATHCGSVEHQSDTSVIIGWGLHGIFANNPDTVNNQAVFTDYNPDSNTVVFELCVKRNPLLEAHEGCFSYRTYKNEN